MKNFYKFLGIIALVTVIGFSMMACEEDDDDGGTNFNGTWRKTENNINYTVTINGKDITITDGTHTFTGTVGEVSTPPAGYDVEILKDGVKKGDFQTDKEITSLSFRLFSVDGWSANVSGLTK